FSIAQLTALIAELEAMGDAYEVFDTLMCLRDDIRDENSKLEGLNVAIAEAEEKIAMKEEHVKTMEAANYHDRMKLVFSGACSEDESFIELMRDLCFGFMMRLNKNRTLIAELEALGQHGDALRSLDYLRDMVVCHSRMLEVLE
nr:hypothetical protein [Tanacetum cinerariifolium]